MSICNPHFCGQNNMKPQFFARKRNFESRRGGSHLTESLRRAPPPQIANLENNFALRTDHRQMNGRLQMNGERSVGWERCRTAVCAGYVQTRPWLVLNRPVGAPPPLSRRLRGTRRGPQYTYELYSRSGRSWSVLRPPAPLASPPQPPTTSAPPPIPRCLCCLGFCVYVCNSLLVYMARKRKPFHGILFPPLSLNLLNATRQLPVNKIYIFAGIGVGVPHRATRSSNAVRTPTDTCVTLNPEPASPHLFCCFPHSHRPLLARIFFLRASFLCDAFCARRLHAHVTAH